jgi:hypothetical protein
MKSGVMFLVLAAFVIIISGCSKDKDSERFSLLTGRVWESDELLVDGQDASGAGQPLEKFVGDAEFKRDGTGYFGQYVGTWFFSNEETNITITSESLLVPLTTTILELTSQRFSITTTFPITGNPASPNLINISFKAKQ